MFNELSNGDTGVVSCSDYRKIPLLVRFKEEELCAFYQLRSLVCLRRNTFSTTSPFVRLSFRDGKGAIYLRMTFLHSSVFILIFL
jgi:hypothetical protein